MRLGRRKPGRHCTPVCRQLAYRPRQGVHFVMDRFAKRDLLVWEVSVSSVDTLDLLKDDWQFGSQLDKMIALGVNDCAGWRGAQRLARRGGRPRLGQPRLAGGDSRPVRSQRPEEFRRQSGSSYSMAGS